MAITILDTIIDEEIRTDPGTPDEHDTTATAAILAAIDAATDATDFGTSPTGFPQFAERADFVSSTNDPAVTNYLLSDSNGDPLATSGAGVATGLFVGGTEVFLYGTSDENIVIGRIGGDTGEIAFVLALEETKDGDGFVTQADMWIGLYHPLVHDGADAVDSADQLDLADLIYLTSEFDTTEEIPFDNFADVPSGQDAFALVGPSSGSSAVDLLITGFKGDDIDTVNVSEQGLGTGNQAVGKGESLRVDIVDANAANFANADTAPEVHDPANIGYAGGHQEAVAAKFEIEQINSNTNLATVTVLAYNTNSNTLPNVQGADFPQDAIDNPGTEVNITGVQILTQNLDGTFTDVTAAFLLRGGTIDLSGNGAVVTGLLVHEWVNFTTAGDDPFTRFTATNTNSTKGNHTWDMGSIRVTVLQGGEDSETEELGSELIFQDDGPLIERNSETVPELAVDDDDFATDTAGDYSGLFDEDEGADASASVAYTLGVTLDGTDAPDSGLVDTGTGHSVFLFLESGEVVGREGTDATDAATGDEVFRVSVDSSGNVTLDQSRAVVHLDSNDHNSSTQMATANLIQLIATISDAEADATDDSASATADIADSFLFFDDGPDIDETSGEDLLVDNTVANDSDSGDFDVDGNNDPNAHMTIVGAPDTGGFAFTFDDSDNNAITGTLNGTELYTLSIDDDGTYLFTLTGELPATPDFLDVTDIKAGGPQTNFIDVGTLSSDDFARLSGFDTNDAPAAINESNANVGVKNGNLDVGESITFELFAPDGADADTLPDPITFLGLSIGTKSAKVSSYLVDIDFVDPSVPDIVDMLVLVGKNQPIVIDPTGDDLIQSITIEKASGSALKLGLGDISILRPPGDFELTFDVQQTDGDGDFDQASFIVEIDGNGDGLITTPSIV